MLAQDRECFIAENEAFAVEEGAEGVEEEQESRGEWKMA